MEKELRFTIEKVDNNIIDLFFDSPEDTKMAFKAIRNHLGANGDGVLLIAKPRYAIVLERSQGAWRTWSERMWRFVNESEGGYYLKVIDDRLVSRPPIYLPAVVNTKKDELPMVI